MEHCHIYHGEIPDFLRACAAAPELRRLDRVGMNCGCEYTSFPLFRGLKPYTRWEHSLGVALIVWHFTGDRAQALSGLMHDIATPVFAHVVDFMRGDYLTQEATEQGTEALIAGSAAVQSVLRDCGLTTADVADYHRYPIADNDSPRLSADRLEYTLGNFINFGLCDEGTAARFYGDLTVACGEDGAEELAFRTEDIALAFAEAALSCSEIYVSDADRYAMQRLAELLKRALSRGVIDADALYTSEPEVIAGLLEDRETADQWRDFRSLCRTVAASEPGTAGEWRRIYAKKRRIDPLVAGRGRVSALHPGFAGRLRAFMDRSQDYWICGAADR